MGGAAFELEGGALLSLARGLSVAALLSVFGALWFRTMFVPAGRTVPAGFIRRWRALLWTSWAAAIVMTLVWLGLQTSSMASTQGFVETVHALPIVLGESSFGHILGVRLLVLLVVAAAMRLRTCWLATVLAAVATALQGGHSHAWAMYDGPSLLLVSEVLHLLAAGAWLGGLLPLLLLVGSASPELAARTSRRFSHMATGCVLVLAITASFQFWVMIGGLPGLVGTGYGLVVLAKLLLFLVLLGFAAVNRFRLTPALGGSWGGLAKRHLGWSIGVETGVGLLVVLAAGVLTNLAPSMHVQPVWPFAERPSLATVLEDADFRLEVIRAALALAGVAALLMLAGLVRRVRWALIGVAAITGWFALPHFGLLFVEAYPTSYYRSPTGFTAMTIAAGAQLYPEYCAACHGAGGQGDGPLAKGLPIPPADLTAGHLWMHADGELFWWLSHGIDAPKGGLAMPGFAPVLSEGDRWALIDFIRANNAGATLQRSGSWSPPIRAPGFEATCGDRHVALEELRGRFVRLVFGGNGVAGAGGDVITVMAGADATSRPAAACAAVDDQVVRAYAVISGVPGDGLDGTQFLIDGEGWLRAIQRNGEPNRWSDPHALAAAVSALRAQPVAAGVGDPMNMRM